MSFAGGAFGGGVFRKGAFSGLPSVGAASVPIALTTTPTSRWVPQFSTVVEDAGRVASATDLMGLAAATEGASGAGPEVVTYANGTKAWRFSGAEYLNIAADLALNGKAFTVAMVGRFHRSLEPGQQSIFCLGNAAQGSPPGWGGANFRTFKGSNEPAYLASVTGFGWTATNTENFLVGSQLQVVALSSGASKSRMGINGNLEDFGGSYAIDATGAEIGRYAASPGSSGNWSTFDLVDMVVFDTALSDTDLATMVSELQVGYGIADVTGQIVLHGDSITKGAYSTGGKFPSGQSGSMALTEPGTSWVPADYRVLNIALSGATVATLVSDRDDTRGFAANTLTDNVVVVQIGFNSLSGSTAAAVYADVVAYINTTTTGLLQRGWDVRVMLNIAGTNATFQTKIESLRALYLASTFLDDCDANTGDTYEGRVSVVRTDLVQDGGELRFADAADAANATYYNDAAHPTAYGTEVLMTGGDTPEYGAAYGLP